MTPQQRPSWLDTWMAVAQLMAARSTCLRRQVGAVLVKDKRIIASGYNGAPTGLAHCRKTGCVRLAMDIPSGERHEVCRGVHSEENCIIQAARFGVSTVGAELYCTHQPCSMCTKTIINAGIATVYYLNGYPDELAREMMAYSDVEFVDLKEEE